MDLIILLNVWILGCEYFLHNCMFLNMKLKLAVSQFSIAAELRS